MISAQIHGRTPRTYEEDDDLYVDGPLPADILSVVWDSAVPNSVHTVVVCSEHLTEPICTHSLSKGLSLCGNIKRSSDGLVCGTVFTSEEYCVLQLPRNDPVVVEQYVEIVNNIMLSINPQSIIFLGGISLSGYVGKGVEGSLRKVLSTNNKGAHDSIPFLEVGNILGGISAHVISFAEAHGISGMAIVSLCGTQSTVSAMKSFEMLLPCLSRLLNSDLSPPAPEHYAAAVKRDPFILRTENLYS